jgi:hypothetical protein
VSALPAVHFYYEGESMGDEPSGQQAARTLKPDVFKFKEKRRICTDIRIQKAELAAKGKGAATSL